MDYGPTDSSGTDDDLPPFLHNRGGPVTGSGKTTAAAPPCSRMQNDMESVIHQLEQEAYCSVLRAFKAQSDAISWEKEGLITELRKELRLSNEEHRELLRRVNTDDIIHRIREWRQEGGGQSNLINNAQSIHDLVPSPSGSASKKRQKTSNSAASLPMGGYLPKLHSQPGAASMHPSASTVRKGNVAGAKTKKTKPNPSSGSSVRDQIKNIATKPGEAAANASLIGRKIMTRWPDDNNFYEAVIIDYKPREVASVWSIRTSLFMCQLLAFALLISNCCQGLHALVYDIHTDNETWEWVNLNEIAPEDIRWVDVEPVMSNPSGRHGTGPGKKQLSGLGGIVPCTGKGGGSSKNQSSKNYMSSQNWTGKKGSQDITIFDTKILVKDVERVLDASPPDPVEIEMAKKMLKEQEQSLIDAIARIGDVSDSESEGEEPLSQRLCKERGRAWGEGQHGRKQQALLFQDPEGSRW
ncbi:protein EMSY-LIKE 3 isoform X1 [Musa acuminata AAA Group]|uniref:protein EMSY-LIKE 3 isoform X1 n=1 Tax=Musa acuminata AAA Group TaxID=214697 RepID=UPI0031DFDD28